MIQLRLRHMMASFQWYEKSYQRTINGICDWSSPDRCFAYDRFRVDAKHLHRAILNYRVNGVPFNQKLNEESYQVLMYEALNCLRESFYEDMNVSSFRHHGKPRVMFSTLKNMILISSYIRKLKNEK